MFKDKKILFAFIFLLLAIILVASSFYFENKKVTIPPKQESNKTGETTSTTPSKFHYSIDSGRVSAFNVDENKTYLPVDQLLDYPVIDFKVSPDNKKVALFINPETLDIVSDDLQNSLYQQKFENETFIYAVLDEGGTGSLGKETSWIDNNTLRVAVYDSKAPWTPTGDCGGCSEEDVKVQQQEFLKEVQKFEEALKNRKPIKFVDIKVK